MSPTTLAHTVPKVPLLEKAELASFVAIGESYV